MQKGSKRNRVAGHNFERKLAILLRPFFPNVVTSRVESKSMDDQKVDLCNTGGFYFQCKCTTLTPNYHKLISEEMPQDHGKINVVVHQKTEKTKNGVFRVKGEYITIKLDVFLTLLNLLFKKK